jgi:hypothetical protein
MNNGEMTYGTRAEEPKPSKAELKKLLMLDIEQELEKESDLSMIEMMLQGINYRLLYFDCENDGYSNCKQIYRNILRILNFLGFYSLNGEHFAMSRDSFISEVENAKLFLKESKRNYSLYTKVQWYREFMESFGEVILEYNNNDNKLGADYTYFKGVCLELAGLLLLYLENPEQQIPPNSNTTAYPMRDLPTKKCIPL